MVRHPIFGGIVLALFGWALVRGSGEAVIAAMALMFFLLAKARFEEARLIARYPQYRRYMQRTRWRILPGL